MAEEIDEGEFYRENFSAESEWEVFNAQLGEVLQKWDVSSPMEFGRPLTEGELYKCRWQIQSEQLQLLNKEIAVDYYKAQLKPMEDDANENVTSFHKELMSQRNNFGPPINQKNIGDLHTLARIYALQRFVVLHPLKLNTQFLTKTAEFNFFLSAASVVAAEVGSAVPIFVQIYDPKWNFFVGIGLAPTLRTNFDLVGLEQAPEDLRYLSGLLRVFKEKLPSTYVKPAMVSVRTTYAMKTMYIRIPMHVPFSNGSSMEDIAITGQVSKLVTSHFHALPRGYFPNSCTEWYAVYTWPELSENIAIDSAMRTDFTPLKAPFGNLYHSVQATSYLSTCLRDYQKLAMSIQSLESYVGKNFSGVSSGADTSNPLDQITQTKLPHLPKSKSSTLLGAEQRTPQKYDLPSLSSVTKKLAGPMNESELNQMLAYLFPDIHPDLALFPYVKASFKHKFDPMRIKTAVPDSLICRLGCLLATCNAHFGGQSGMAQLWAAFTRQLRLLWDNCLTVPGIAAGFPDTRTCLLHQKLQMLNVCVERTLLHQSMSKKRVGNNNETFKPKRSPSPKADNEFDDDENEDDEFYDCDEALMLHMALADAAAMAKSLNTPEGREKRLGEERLLEHEEEYLYIPLTQEPVPKTEDQLQSDAEVMLKLGPGSGLTTQMMCSSLLSDMEAFKAANPKAVMADFIRWYSPRDWVAEEQEDGSVIHQMSARMLAPGNTWQTVWQQAQPVPVARQKRLFDDTNEALKVLHYLETRNLGEIFGLTVLPALHSAVLMLMDIFNNAQVDELFSSQIESLLNDLCRLSREVAVDEVPDVSHILTELEQLETQFYQYQCFKSTFDDSANVDIQRQFEAILATKERGNNSAIAAGNGARLTEMLQQKFGTINMDEHLISKDYIIRLDGDTTATSSTAKEMYLGPQFLRAIVTGEKLRLCGAFTESTTFI